LVFSTWLDSDALLSHGEFTRFIRRWGEWILRFAVVYGTAFISLIYLRSRDTFRELSESLRDVALSSGYFAGHVAAVATLWLFSSKLFGRQLAGGVSDLLTLGCLFSGAAAIVLGGYSFIPPHAWRTLLRRNWPSAFYGAAAGLMACLIGPAGWRLWRPAAEWTFSIVTLLIRPFGSRVVIDPAKMLVGTDRFTITIDPPCSGFEGAGLIVAFGVVLLWLFRREWRFPRALLLIPAGIAGVWFLNCFRLAGLILIGDAGAPGIATGGFHSQAGWIGFNGVALSLAFGVRRLRWFTITPAPAREANPAVPYLAPLLGITVAAMVAKASMAEFEWLYPLRVAVAFAVLYRFRETYRKLDWRFSGSAVFAGIFVFAIWITPGMASSSEANQTAAAGFLRLPPVWRSLWLVCRLFAAVVTVPIAEELAFRAFLIRRIVDQNFLSIDPRRYTWKAVAISSLAFGLLHGSHWAAGSLAGGLYAAVYLRRGRMGDAFAAHALTNAILAGYVFLTGRWDLW
jgi:exosortase E/protease (VPEID-CTERM system)